MQRIPEPELMNEAAQAKAYAEADFSESNSLFVSQFCSRFSDIRPSRILDLGCGPGDIAIRFAQTFPDATVTGVDGAEAMLVYATNLGKKAGVDDRVDFVQARIERYQDDAGFDVILSNSLLHHLAQPAVLWDAVKSCGSGGAVVCIMDLMRPASAEVVDALVEHYAGGEPEILRRDFRHSLMAAYLPQEVRAQLRQAGLDCLRVEVVSDRHLLAAGRLA